MREPAVAGQFYPLERQELEKMLTSFFEKKSECAHKNTVLGCIVPHAGYVFSGKTAARAYAELRRDREVRTAVIIGPNHTALGTPGVSVSFEDWKTPLGVVKTDKKIAEKIVGTDFSADEAAHEYEHSAEVQLPFLQYLFKDLKIVAVSVFDQRLELMKKLGLRLAEVLEPAQHAVIASTDFSHYVEYSEAYKRDHAAFAALKTLDADKLYDAVRDYDISMCGPGPVAAVLTYAEKAGAKTARLLEYATSGDTPYSGRDAVVGYAAVVITK